MLTRFAHALSATALAAVMLVATRAAAVPVVLDFDTLPAAPWTENSCEPAIDVSVSGGVLTIETPSCHEFDLVHPAGAWHQKVDNTKGWAVEARMLLDGNSEDNGPGTAILWMNDHTNLVIVGFTTTEVRLQYPEYVGAALDTTDGFHVYRVVSVLDQVWIYVDGVLRIAHTLPSGGAGSDILGFGDGASGYSRSHWDYLWYDVDGCAEGQCDPDGGCAELAPCDDDNPCTAGDQCKGNVCMSGPLITCPALDTCHEAGICLPESGCTQPPKPDGTPCPDGTCFGGACVAGSSGGAGGAPPDRQSTELIGLYGRAGCYCGLADGRAGRDPGWLTVIALLACCACAIRRVHRS